jgi:tetratricopeptide (TPR) repeat protein
LKRLLALMLLVAAPALPNFPALAAPSDPTRYAACIEMAGKDPARAMQLAYAWRIEGGGVASRHCLAVAQMHARHHDAALKSYEAAGQASEDARDGRAIVLWRQAADAAMIADMPAEAVRFLGRALAMPGGLELSPRAEADLLTTRAEAHVAVGKPDLAMADLTRATEIASDFFTPWLLKATLARRQGNLAVAEAALLKAAALAPESADVELEAGNIAAAKGDMPLARQAWEAAAADAPDTPAGQAAAAALGRMSATIPKDALGEKPLTKDALPATPR